MPRSQIGSLIYDIVADTSQFTAGMITSKREIAELKKVALDSGTAVDRLAADFAKLTRLSRDAEKGLTTASVAFGKLTTSNKRAQRAAQDHIATLRAQAAALRQGVKGRSLTRDEVRRVQMLERSADEFEKQIAIQRKLRAEELRVSAQRKRTARDDAAAAAHVKEAHRKNAEQARVMRESERQANREFVAAQNQARAAIQRRLSPQRKLVQEMRQLRTAHQQGTISTNEYNRAQARLSRTLRGMRNPVVQQTKAFAGLKGQVIALAKQIAFITAGYKLLHASVEAVKKAMEMERAVKQFEIFLDSATMARDIMADLRDIAARTPLTLTSTTQATRTLLQYGVAGNDVIDTLKRLGDVSGGSHESLQRLALAFGQITANGRLQGQELRQLTEAGFNPLQVIAEKTGKSMLDLRVDMANGQITIDMIRNALIDATEAGGRFNHVLETIGKETAFGKAMIFAGELEKAMVDLGTNVSGVVGDLADTGVEAIKDIRNAVKFWQGFLEEFREYFGVQEQSTAQLEHANKIIKQREQLIIAGRKAEAAALEPNIAMGERERRLHKGLLVGMWARYEIYEEEHALRVKLGAEARKEAEAANQSQVRRDNALTTLGEMIAEEQKEQAELQGQTEELQIQQWLRDGILQTEIDQYLQEKQKTEELEKQLELEKQIAKEKEREEKRLANEAEKWKDKLDGARAYDRKIADINRLQSMGALSPQQAQKARNMALAEQEAKEFKEDIKREEKRKELAREHRKELLKEFELRKKLIEIQHLENIGVAGGGLSPKEAAERRKQLREEFLERRKNEFDKENKERKLTPVIRKGSVEEYKLLARIATDRDEKAKRERFQKAGEKFWTDAVNEGIKIASMPDLDLEALP